MKIILEAGSIEEMDRICKGFIFDYSEKRSTPANVSSEEIKIVSLGLEGLSVNSLHAGGLYTIGDLINKSIPELLSIPNIGKKSMIGITDAVHCRGLNFKTD